MTRNASRDAAILGRSSLPRPLVNPKMTFMSKRSMARMIASDHRTGCHLSGFPSREMSTILWTPYASSGYRHKAGKISLTINEFHAGKDLPDDLSINRRSGATSTTVLCCDHFSHFRSLFRVTITCPFRRFGGSKPHTPVVPGYDRSRPRR